MVTQQEEESCILGVRICTRLTPNCPQSYHRATSHLAKHLLSFPFASINVTIVAVAVSITNNVIIVIIIVVSISRTQIQKTQHSNNKKQDIAHDDNDDLDFLDDLDDFDDHDDHDDDDR